MAFRFTTFLLFCSFIAVGQPQLVRDIIPGTASSISSNATLSQATVIGNNLLFIADDGTNGLELWRSDGTENGTVLLKDIYAGNDDNGAGTFFILYDSVLYFSGFNVEYGQELWRSDGTPEGTYLFWDACTGNCDGPVYGNYDSEFVIYNGTLYFRSSTAASGTELFLTNGDSAAVSLLKEISSGGGSSSPGEMAVWNGKLFFAANVFNYGRELWISDGTETGTNVLKDISPGGFSSGDPRSLIATDSLLFFSATTFDNGRELWKTNGTEAGTLLVKDINPNTGSSVSTDIRDFVILNNKLLFVANDGVNGNELWVSDGTENGTQMLKNIGPGGANSLLKFMGQINDKQLFAVNTLNTGAELWMTDGTSDGTLLVKDIQPNSIADIIYPQNVVYQGRMYFAASDAVSGLELWQTDGTAAGTKLLEDINSGAAGSNPSNFQLTGSTLFFFAETPMAGRELWKLELKPPTALFEVQDSVCQNESVLFTAFDGNAESWSWHFGDGAQPPEAQGPGPHSVTYYSAGSKTVRLIATNAFGADTAIRTIIALPLPQADFIHIASDLTVTFTNISSNADSYFWQFGDGTTGTEANPEHTYASPGTYTVVLQAINNCATVEKSVMITLTSATSEPVSGFSIHAHPNPVNDILWIKCGVSSFEPMRFSLFDASGSLVQSGEFKAIPGVFIPVEIAANIPSGQYRLAIQSTNHSSMIPVIIQKN